MKLWKKVTLPKKWKESLKGLSLEFYSSFIKILEFNYFSDVGKENSIELEL